MCGKYLEFASTFFAAKTSETFIKFTIAFGVRSSVKTSKNDFKVLLKWIHLIMHRYLKVKRSGEKSIVFVMTILTGKEISKPMKFRE